MTRGAYTIIAVKHATAQRIRLNASRMGVSMTAYIEQLIEENTPNKHCPNSRGGD